MSNQFTETNEQVHKGSKPELLKTPGQSERIAWGEAPSRLQGQFPNSRFEKKLSWQGREFGQR